jgi:hypothetical protein
MAPNRAPSRRMNQSLTPRSCFHSVEFTLPHHQDGSEKELADLELKIAI